MDDLDECMPELPSPALAKEQARIRTVSSLIFEAEKPLRVLRLVSWDVSVRDEFFKTNARELPQVTYDAIDAAHTRTVLSEAKGMLQDGKIDRWFKKLIHTVEITSAMLQARGTKEFWGYSKELYGSPATPLDDGISTPSDLASLLVQTLGFASACDLGPPPEAHHPAQAVADAISIACQKLFKEAAPEVTVVDELSANAIAGPRRILLRRNARFTDKDITQLIHHEAFVHVATSLNGLAQDQLRILGSSHAATTRTQEGLAVFAELINGAMDVDRLRRLSNRVIAIRMAEEGADFLQVYRFFLQQDPDPLQSFENTRRVFRGGVLSGGGPFTKDCVYLDGLLRVHNFLRIAVAAGRSDCLHLLFCGKLDIDDIGIISGLMKMGICKPPRYLPPWIRDLRFLVSYLAYSAFLNKVDLNKLKSHYAHLLNEL